jgi:hypothetical protein
MTTTPRPRLPWYYWQIAALIAFALAGLGALGEWLGWWHTVGDVLMWVGTIAGLVLAFNSATERSVGRLDVGLAENTDKLVTIGVVLERIERLLEARLPRPSEGASS